MPGIVTHSRILKESIRYLSKKEKKSYLLKSIETLFNTPEHFTAGLFGAIGPNIFDYIPKRNKVNYYGNEISFFFHNGGSDKLLQTMTKKIYTYKDKNTEWAAIQRAYLYGMISHIITDSVFHPFIFYYSGFPASYTKKELYFFREQNLVFQYNIDNYLQYHEDRARDYTFNLDEMLPLNKLSRFKRLDAPLQSFILESINTDYPDIYKKLILIARKNRISATPVSYLDFLPIFIRIAYMLKRNNNARVANLFRNMRRNNLFYSDFIVRYPMNRRYNKNILNLHRERWENPAGKPGLHYESVLNLLSIACDKTVELWEKIESSLYGNENQKVMQDFNINAYTGDPHLSYHDMKIKRAVRLGI